MSGNSIQLDDLSGVRKSHDEDDSESLLESTDSMVAVDLSQDFELGSNKYRATQGSLRNVLRLFSRQVNFKVIILVVVVLLVGYSLIKAVGGSLKESSGTLSSVKQYLDGYKNTVASVQNSTIVSYVPSYLKLGSAYDDNDAE